MWNRYPNSSKLPDCFIFHGVKCTFHDVECMIRAVEYTFRAVKCKTDTLFS